MHGRPGLHRDPVAWLNLEFDNPNRLLAREASCLVMKSRVGMPSHTTAWWWVLRVPVLALLALLILGGSACGSSHSSSSGTIRKASVGAALPGLASAAVGSWVCSNASSASVTAKVNANGTLELRQQPSPATAGKWTLDQKGIHAQFNSDGLGSFQVDVLNAALATDNWQSVSQATMVLQISALHLSTSGTVSIHLNGLNEVTFQATPTRPGGVSSPWTCHRG